MEREYSILLDLVRVLAALTVFLDHFSYLGYKGMYQGFFHDFGHAGVIMFFVLSGYVIAFVADTKHSTFSGFMSARLARLYSVLLFALVLTFFLDKIGSAVDPIMYKTIPDSEPLTRFVANLLFLQQTSWFSIKYFSNGPMWSLAYEFWYYLIFAIAVFVKGRYRWPALALALFVAGVKILLLMPCWLAGVYVYKLHQRDSLKPSRDLSLLLVFVSSVLFWYLASQQAFVDHIAFYLGNFGVNPIALVFSKWFITDYFLALFFAVFIFAIRTCPVPRFIFSPTATRTIRTWAGFSFSLYLYHVPLILFIDALSIFDGMSEVSSFFFGACVLFISYALSLVSEKKLPFYKRMFGGLSVGMPRAKAEQ